MTEPVPRDPSAPILNGNTPRFKNFTGTPRCGFILTMKPKTWCGDAALYEAYLNDGDGRPTLLCQAHAEAARHWPELELMRDVPKQFRRR